MKKQMICIVLVFLFSIVSFAEGNQTTGVKRCFSTQICIPDSSGRIICYSREICNNILQPEESFSPDFFDFIKNFFTDLIN